MINIIENIKFLITVAIHFFLEIGGKVVKGDIVHINCNTAQLNNSNINISIDILQFINIHITVNVSITKD